MWHKAVRMVNRSLILEEPYLLVRRGKGLPCLTCINQDQLEWALDKSKCFITKSLYRFLSRGGCGNIWTTKLPLKIKVFLWQLSNNKMETTCNLKKHEKGISIVACVVK
jgi:hypothetical protein